MCPPRPSRTGTTPDLSAASATTTRMKCSTTHPDPTRQPRTKDNASPPADLHKHDILIHRPEGVQDATSSFAWGVWGGILTTAGPSKGKTASKAPTYFESRSRIRKRNEVIRSPRSITRLRAA